MRITLATGVAAIALVASSFAVSPALANGNWWCSSQLQAHDAENAVDHGNDNTQKIKQKQNLFLFGSMCGPVQSQDADNSVKKGSDNTQKIYQKQNAAVGFAFGTSQKQDADNSVYKGHDNSQTIKQKQNRSGCSSSGAWRSRRMPTTR